MAYDDVTISRTISLSINPAFPILIMILKSEQYYFKELEERTIFKS